MDDLIERARKLGEPKRYPMSFDGHNNPVEAIVDPEELTAMKAVIRDLADALDARWQTMESAPRDGTPILVWRDGHPIVRASVWRVRPKMLPDWETHIIRDGMDPPFEGFPILTRLGDAKAPTHWHPLPPPPEDV